MSELHVEPTVVLSCSSMELGMEIGTCLARRAGQV